MSEPDDLVDILYGEHGIMYELGSPLSERILALAEIVRRRFEKAGHVVRAQNPSLPEEAKQIADEYERKVSSFLGSGVVLLVGHG